MQDQKAGILNAMNTIATKNTAQIITDHIVEVGVEAVTTESVSGLADVSEATATRVIAALELHKTLASVKVRKQREKKPSIAERYVTDTSEETRDDMAIRVAVLRINAEGSRPTSWRNIREELGLKLDQFHQVIRKSDGWVRAVCGRIAQLKLDNPEWSYNGKLDVLTGIDGFEMSIVQGFIDKVKAEREAEEVTQVEDIPTEEVDLQQVAEGAERIIDTPSAA